MADGVYNGMPASELPDLQWRLAGSATDPRGEGGVEMARLPDGQIAVRNAADPAGPALIYTKAEIEALIGGAQDGDFDPLLSLPADGKNRHHIGPPSQRFLPGGRPPVPPDVRAGARTSRCTVKTAYSLGDGPAPGFALARGRRVRGCGG